MATYNIYNPTPARRVIYDGTEAQQRIEIMPKQTLEGVHIEDHVAAKFIKQGKLDDSSELQLTLVAGALEAEEPESSSDDEAKELPRRGRGRR